MPIVHILFRGWFIFEYACIMTLTSKSDDVVVRDVSICFTWTVWVSCQRCNNFFAGVCEFPFVISDQLSGEHGPPLWKLGQDQACSHIWSVPLWAEGFPQLLLQGNPQCVETVLILLLQNCPPWVFILLCLYFTFGAGTSDFSSYFCNSNAEVICFQVEVDHMG